MKISREIDLPGTPACQDNNTHGMTARVLDADDLLPNIKLHEARLSAEYFEVLTATNGVDALKICPTAIATLFFSMR